MNEAEDPSLPCVLVVTDWRRHGQVDSIYQTDLGIELTSRDVHAGTSIHARIVFDDPEYSRELQEAWNDYRATVVVSVVPDTGPESS